MIRVFLTTCFLTLCLGEVQAKRCYPRQQQEYYQKAVAVKYIEPQVLYFVNPPQVQPAAVYQEVRQANYNQLERQFRRLSEQMEDALALEQQYAAPPQQYYAAPQQQAYAPPQQEMQCPGPQQQTEPCPTCDQQGQVPTQEPAPPVGFEEKKNQWLANNPEPQAETPEWWTWAAAYKAWEAKVLTELSNPQPEPLPPQEPQPGPGQPAMPEAPKFSMREVKTSLFEKRCLKCHSEGGKAEEVALLPLTRKRAIKIAEEVNSGNMPRDSGNNPAPMNDQEKQQFFAELVNAL